MEPQNNIHMKFMRKKSPVVLITPDQLTHQIYVIRGQKVMLDADLAAVYDIPTKHINQAVQRNMERFPSDFMFQLTENEEEILRSQIVTSNTPSKRGGRKYAPYVFTEHGVAMLSSVLRSDRAVQMNILIIRAFVKLRDLLASNKDLAARMEKLEARQTRHSSIIEILAEEIHALKAPPPLPKKRRIGYI